MTVLATTHTVHHESVGEGVTYHSSPYRWVVLLSVVPILAITQMYWLTFSAISPQAAAFYHTSGFVIAVLSMSYMFAYVALSIPASWLVDRKGIRVCLLVGAIITAVFGVLRGVLSSSFPLVALSQLAMACAQPFVMNPITKLAAQWFAMGERATVSGIASVAGYLGIVIAMAITPTAYQAVGMASMLNIMGIVAVLAAVAVVAGVKERPAVSPGPSAAMGQALNWRDAFDLRHNKNYMRLLVIVMIALGMFNALLTCLSDIMLSRGISSDEAGFIGSVIIIMGIVGAVVLPMMSDRMHRRRIFIVVAVIASTIALIGLTYFSVLGLLLVCAAISGFFLMGSGPLIFQYGTEEGYPAPEGTTYGLMMGSGQVSGIVFIIMLYALQSAHGSMTLPLTLLVAVMIVATVLTFSVRESRFAATREQ